MAAAQRLKASDRQSICKKLVTSLRKHYKCTPPKHDHPVLETLLYGVCLENASEDEAAAAFAHLHDDFHDLNEVRVSSISELAQAFEGMSDPELRAMRVRGVLQQVFEAGFEFEFETIRRKTLDAATRQLAKLRETTVFVRLYTLQAALGSHVVPIDDATRCALVWLGLVEPDSKNDEAAETMKSAVRKSDAPLLCCLLRALATDPKHQDEFAEAPENVPEEGWDGTTAVNRLNDLLSGKSSAKKKKAAASSSRSSSTKKKTTAKKKTASKKSSTGSTTKKKKTKSRTKR